VYGGCTSDMAYIFQRNKFWPLRATYSHKFLWTEEETICGHFTDNATGCTVNFQMTAPKDRLSKLLQTHEVWPARQKNVNKGNCYLCVTNTFSLCKHLTFFERDDCLCQGEKANTIKPWFYVPAFSVFSVLVAWYQPNSHKNNISRFYAIFRWYPQKCCTTY